MVKLFMINSYHDEFPDARNEAILNYIRNYYKSKKRDPGKNRTRQPAKRYLAFNISGNVVVSTTNPKKKIPNKLNELFNQAITFFAIWSKALEKANKSLHDVDAIRKMIERSGLFVCLESNNKTFNYTQGSGQLNTAIINDVLSVFEGRATDDSLAIVQRVLGFLGDELKHSIESNEPSKKIGHVMISCEYLEEGMPFVVVILFNTTIEDCRHVTEWNCHNPFDKNVSIKYSDNWFLFVDPEHINKYTEEFKRSPEFNQMIDNHADKIY